MCRASRAIVVFGLSHSATTVLAYVLSTHPRVRLIADGRHCEVLESDALMQRDWQAIRAVLLKYPEHRLVFKHPWAQENLSFFAEHMREAKYLYCWREMAEVAKSWRKHKGPTPYGPPSRSQAVYRLHRELKERFPEVVKPSGFMVVNHDDLVLKPTETMGRVAAMLRIEPDFDVGIVKPGASWERRLWLGYLHAKDVEVRGSEFEFFTGG